MCKVQGSEGSQRRTTYQLSFQKFSRTVAAIQLLNAQRSFDHAEFARAVIDLEHARVSYNQARDALAAELLESVLPPQPDPSWERQVRTKNIARLLWEYGGQPTGTADADWRCAEQIIDRVEA